MDPFVCNNPVVLQDAMTFGLKPWIAPLVCLTIAIWATCLIAGKLRTSKDVSFSKTSWIWPLIAFLNCIGLAYLSVEDYAHKRHVFQSGEYVQMEGSVTKITPRHGAKTFSSVSHISIRINIEGTQTNADGRKFDLDGRAWSSGVKTNNGWMAYGGKSCPDRSCGLEIGDKIRILTEPHKEDTLRIEKCETVLK